MAPHSTHHDIAGAHGCAHSRGLSLIETLTVLTVMAIAWSSSPSPRSRTCAATPRATAVVNQFFHALFLARSESIKRGKVVSVCKSADGRTCVHRGVDWTVGWIVFVNADRDDLPQCGIRTST